MNRCGKDQRKAIFYVNQTVLTTNERPKKEKQGKDGKSREKHAKELSEQLGYSIEVVRLLNARNGKYRLNLNLPNAQWRLARVPLRISFRERNKQVFMGKTPQKGTIFVLIASWKDKV